MTPFRQGQRPGSSQLALAPRYNVALLDPPMSKVRMVAAHPGEPVTVSQRGMQTAFVHRPKDFDDHGQRLPSGQHVDVECDDIDEHASAPGA